MKHQQIAALLCLLTVLGSQQFLFGQKTELRLNAFSGLFSFRGEGAASTSWINFNPYISPEKFTSNPYGRKSGFSYTFELQGQRVTKARNIYGIAIGFETLRSRVNIDTLTQNGFIYWQFPARGNTFLKNTFVTIHPYIGHRYVYRKINFDLLAGCDFAFCLESRELGNATANDMGYDLAVDNIKSKPVVDVRPGVRIKTQLNKFGFIAGYSLGLTNYQTQNNPKVYSSFLRLGFSYQVK
jgi:hypothetical protein